MRGGGQPELRLHGDYRDDGWNRNAYRAGGDLSWVATTEELAAGRASVERLPAEVHRPDAAPR